MDGGLTNTLADELAELLDMIRLKHSSVDSCTLDKYLSQNSFDSAEQAIATIVTILPKGTQVCLK